MITDTRHASRGGIDEADVCVIGGGAAGISLARELDGSRASVVLLEGGGLVPEEGDRGIYEVLPGPRAALVVDPLRPWYLGGATNHWSGNCRPLDSLDFEQRDWVPHSGWPIDREELVPYYERAQRLAALGDFAWYDLDACRSHLGHPPLDVDPGLLTPKVVQQCPTLSFAELHRRHLEESSNVGVLLRARARSLELNGQADRVEAVEFVEGDGTPRRVRAKVVVLAAGGVENARLLLCSREPKRTVEASHDAVGRFFMEHWHLDIPLGGWGDGIDLTCHDELQTVDGTGVWTHLALSDELMRSLHIPGLSMWFHRLPRTTPSLVAARRIVASALGRARPEPLTDLQLLFSDPGEVVASAARRITRRPRDNGEGYLLRVQFEQAPNPENRIRLSATRDRLGQPRAEVVLASDHNDPRRQTRALRTAVDSIGLDGRRIERQTRLLMGAGRFGGFWHHMGTTRMSDHPDRGVVDADCRVHGVSNLFVAGSSVFPTGGTAAPTLTIVALAARLADHIRGLTLSS
jgi:choline dehydrogenase-like flavoprotein